MKKQCKTQRRNVSNDTRALCKKLGCSVRLYQAMNYWMFRQWLRCRMREYMRQYEVGLCGEY